MPLNSDQADYAAHIAAIPRDRRCKCGWHMKAECSNYDCRVELIAEFLRERWGGKVMVHPPWHTVPESTQEEWRKQARELMRLAGVRG